MAKIKINIPAQSFEIEADFQPIWEMQPPKPEPLPIPEEKPEEPVSVKPPVIEVGIQNITNEWNEMLDRGDTNFILSAGTFEVKTIKRQNVNREITLAGEDSTVIFGKENYNKWSDSAQDSQLFMLEDGADFYCSGINFIQPKQIKNVEPWMPTLFASVQNPDARWKAVVKDCDTTKIGRHGGFGLGTLYGSNKGNLIAAINYKHLGNGFIEGKASIGENQGILKVYLKDVVTDGSNEEEFGSNRLKVTGYIKNNVFTITSDHSTQFLNNHFFNTDKGDNYSHILHLGRFTFMIDDIEAVLNDKQIRLRPNANGQVRVIAKDGKLYTPRFESHAGDIVGSNVMIEKGRDEHPLWSNNFNPKGSEIAYHPYLIPKSVGWKDGIYNFIWHSSFDQEGIEQEAYLISKGNDTFRTYPHTKFGESWEILRGQIVGHNMYNHAEITLYAENVIQKGYYRQTSRFGKSLGYFINNSEGFRDEFNPKVEVKSKLMTLDEFELL